MANRAIILAAALLTASSAPPSSYAFDDDPLGLAAGARVVERVVTRGRQGMFMTAFPAPGAREGRLSVSVLQWGATGLQPDLLTLSGRCRALDGLWLSARLSQPPTRGPAATLGLNWETGPVAWTLSAATARSAPAGPAPGADLSGIWRF